MSIKVMEQAKEQPGRKILVLLDNLFFAAKINQAASSIGATVNYAKTSTKALEAARNELPSLIIVDLEATACSPLELITGLKNDEGLRAAPVIGFLSHVNTGLQEDARAAGCDRVLARSVFDRNLVDLLKERY